jgi:hypothetical protein
LISFQCQKIYETQLASLRFSKKTLVKSTVVVLSGAGVLAGIGVLTGIPVLAGLAVFTTAPVEQPANIMPVIRQNEKKGVNLIIFSP